jgi:hypothetical protein
MVTDETIPYVRTPIKSKVFKNDNIEIRVYDGDDDPTKMNLKRIGVYLFKNNEFIASEWIECGKVVGGLLLNKPEMTNEVKDKLTKKAISNMKDKLRELEKKTVIDLQNEALKK